MKNLSLILVPVVACFGSFATDITGNFFHLPFASVQDRALNFDGNHQAAFPGKKDPFTASAKYFLSNYIFLSQLTSCEKSIFL